MPSSGSPDLRHERIPDRYGNQAGRERDDSGGNFSAPVVPGALPPSGITSYSPILGASPLGLLSLVSSMTIHTATPTFLSFTPNNISQIFAVDPSDATRILVSGVMYAAEIKGNISWQVSASGIRTVKLYVYNNVSALIGSAITLFSALADSFYVGYPFANVGVGSLKVEVTQTSGGDLVTVAGLAVCIQ